MGFDFVIIGMGECLVVEVWDRASKGMRQGDEMERGILMKRRRRSFRGEVVW